jgi:hypothetical protein
VKKPPGRYLMIWMRMVKNSMSKSRRLNEKLRFFGL